MSVSFDAKSSLFQVKGWHAKLLAAGLVFVIAIATRILFVLLFKADVPEYGDAWYYLKLSENLLNGQGYKEGNLMAYRPPLFPLFITGIQYLFGTTVEAVRIVQAVVGAIVCVLIFYMGWIIGGARAGIIAGMLSIIYPPLIFYSTQILSENLFIFLTLLAVLCVSVSGSNPHARWRILAGVCFGLSALTREVGLFVAFGTLAWYLLNQGNILLGFGKWLIIVLFALLTISPWTLRNYLNFRTLVPISTNTGINFYIGNNPAATGTFQWVVPPSATWNKPSPNGYYEIEANRLGLKAGMRFIAEQPTAFLQLTLKRFGLMVIPPYQNIDNNTSALEFVYRLIWLFMYIVIFVSGIIVSPIMLYKQYRNLSLLYITIFILLLPHVFTVANFRYQLPIMPFAIVLAAMVLAKLLPEKLKCAPIFSKGNI